MRMQQKAEDFFKKHATSNLAPDQTGMDRKPAAEAKNQWARLMNFEEVLVGADKLFRELGATTPSIDAATMAELVMGQYELAKRKNDEGWLREARHWAINFFPFGWVDSHLHSWKKGKQLITRLPSTSDQVDYIQLWKKTGE